MTENQPFSVLKDRFSCIDLDLKEALGDSRVSPDEFEARILAALRWWEEDGVRCVTVKVPLTRSAFIGVLAKHGFDYHHAQPGYAMMLRWLSSEEPNNFPPYANHYLGVAGFVLNDNNEVLVVKERFGGPSVSRWKFPGGHADKGEHFAETARREVLEETGVECEFVTLLCLRHMHGYRYGCSDVYAVCLMRATSTAIRRCQFEITDCAWMPLDEFESSTSAFNAKLVALYRQYASTGACMPTVDVPPLTDDKWSLLYFAAAGRSPTAGHSSPGGSTATLTDAPELGRR